MKYDSKIARYIRGIATISIVIYGTYYIYSNLDSFRVLLEINWNYITIMIIFSLFSGFASSSENAVLFQALGASIGYVESYGLSNVCAFFSLVLPQGGTLAKVVYLKQKYKIPFSRTLALFLSLLVITLLLGAGVMLITNLITMLIGGTVPFILWIATLTASASGLLFLFDFPQDSLAKLGKVGALLSNFSSGWKSLRTNKSCLIKACVWQLVTFISSGIMISAAYYSLGIKINPFLGISLAVLISIANIFIIVPGNIGILEFTYGYFTYLSGLLFFQGVVISTLLRVIGLLTMILLAPFSWYYLFYKQNIKIGQQ